jgi:translation initiation factor IF-3
VNRRIRVPEVRVIAADDKQLGIMPTFEAMKMAEESGLDLVEVSPKAMPPVCRIMDYGKFKFEQAKKARQARKHASVIEVKEIKFRPKTDEHDFEFKVRHIRRFLEEGNKVRLVIAFRGREIVHPETGKAMLDEVIKALLDVAHVEQLPMMDGKRMNMVVSPKPQRGATIPPPIRPPGSPTMPPPMRPATAQGPGAGGPPVPSASASTAGAPSGQSSPSPSPAAAQAQQVAQAQAAASAPPAQAGASPLHKK